MTGLSSIKDYVAGVTAYLYPGFGEQAPPSGVKVLLLTRGCICTPGAWSNDGRYLGWSPLPRRPDYAYPTRDGEGKCGSGNKLLLTQGEICALGPWTDDGRYLGWAELPKRDQAKEGVLLTRHWELRLWELSLLPA